MQEEKSPVAKIFIGGKWKTSMSSETYQVFNPSTGQVISRIPYSTKEEVDEAIDSAHEAFQKWKTVPMGERVKFLFKMKDAFERHYDELSALNSENHGKTLIESKGDLRRTLDNIEVAIGVGYTLAKGETMDQVAPGIDESSAKEPLGVFSIICPFNFPLMIPFWFIPYALVLGDTLVIKPSEITPLPMDKAMKIIEDEVKLPPGILNILHGSKEVSEELIRNEKVRGVAFVGSTPVAKQIYRLAGEYGKRALANGGAKNPIVIMPDADLDLAVTAATASFFGNAGQRCLAGANFITVGGIHDDAVAKLKESALRLKVGNALDADTEMGPVVSESAKKKIIGKIGDGLEEGAKAVIDGRTISVRQYPEGFYLGPTILDGVTYDMGIAKQEIFGPVASTISCDTLDGAIDIINQGTEYGNMASIFTSSGRSAREFRRNVDAGNIGVNVGVASPAANFPFGGRKQSFFGTLHAQIDTVSFFTDSKVVVSRW